MMRECKLYRSVDLDQMSATEFELFVDHALECEFHGRVLEKYDEEPELLVREALSYGRKAVSEASISTQPASFRAGSVVDKPAPIAVDPIFERPRVEVSNVRFRGWLRTWFILVKRLKCITLGLKREYLVHLTWVFYSIIIAVMAISVVVQPWSRKDKPVAAEPNPPYEKRENIPGGRAPGEEESIEPGTVADKTTGKGRPIKKSPSAKPRQPAPAGKQAPANDEGFDVQQAVNEASSEGAEAYSNGIGDFVSDIWGSAFKYGQEDNIDPGCWLVCSPEIVPRDPDNKSRSTPVDTKNNTGSSDKVGSDPDADPGRHLTK